VIERGRAGHKPILQGFQLRMKTPDRTLPLLASHGAQYGASKIDKGGFLANHPALAR
jgi:hypothetical protein